MMAKMSQPVSVLVILVLFPQISMFLPNLIFR